jgi:hypothetical protein
MNMSEAMKIKRQIQDRCGVETKMCDLPEVGLVLTVDRSALDMNSYKLLSEYTTENNLTLQLEMGRYLISNQDLSSSGKSFGVERVF